MPKYSARAGDAMHDRHHHRQHRPVNLQVGGERTRVPRRCRRSCFEVGHRRSPEPPPRPVSPPADRLTVTSINTKLEPAANTMQYVFYVVCLRQIRRPPPVLPCASTSPTSICFATSSRRAALPMAPSAQIWRSPPPRPASARWNWRLAPSCWCVAAPASPRRGRPYAVAARARDPGADRTASGGPQPLRARARRSGAGPVQHQRAHRISARDAELIPDHLSRHQRRS